MLELVHGGVALLRGQGPAELVAQAWLVAPELAEAAHWLVTAVGRDQGWI